MYVGASDVLLERPREGPGKVMVQNGQGGTREFSAKRGARGSEAATGIMAQGIVHPIIPSV